jgi:hypothetical protein
MFWDCAPAGGFFDLFPLRLGWLVHRLVWLEFNKTQSRPEYWHINTPPLGRYKLYFSWRHSLCICSCRDHQTDFRYMSNTVFPHSCPVSTSHFYLLVFFVTTPLSLLQSHIFNLSCFFLSHSLIIRQNCRLLKEYCPCSAISLRLNTHRTSHEIFLVVLTVTLSHSPICLSYFSFL